MNILILGSGGREHALSWKIDQSRHCEHLYIAPGNAGTDMIGTNVDLDITDFPTIASFVKEKNIEIVLVGPEQPLVLGITDYLEDEFPFLTVIGPGKDGAELEGSKAFAKEFMAEFDIPTAGYVEITSDNIEEGIFHIKNTKGPYVLKADGLAAGKGVLIIDDIDTAVHELQEMLSGKFGSASQTVVIEEFLDGIEFSVFVLTDGSQYAILPQAKDYKRVGEGDKGLNTGGMGAISPVSFVDDVMMQKVMDRIVLPTVKGINSRKLRYRGFVFIGLIVVDGEPLVIEYNCRMGDPETQVVIPRLENDLVDLFLALEIGNLNEIEIKTNPSSAATIVCASGGYPESYKKGYSIEGLDKIKDSIVFHAGTKEENKKILTSGGRVLAVTSYGEDKEAAVSASLESLEKISFEDMYFRRDIGFDLS